MNDGQWRLIYPGADYTFGTAETLVWNKKAPEIGTPDVKSSDVDRPRSDGRAFGVDYVTGQTISFDLGVRASSDAGVREATSLLKKVWRADPVRLTPGAVAELRAQYAGRERIVYGRPRRFSPDFSDAAINHHVSVLADFACVDDVWYGPDDSSIQFGIVPPLGGGLLAPLASPLSTTMSSDRSQGFDIVSELDVWPVATLYGPIARDAVITIGTHVRWEVRVDLDYDETVTIDTRPWVRSALRNGSANVAGSIRGTRLSKSALPSGRYEVGLKGTDPTGTARIRLAWRPAYSSL